uniref:Uncharacterized protein n=1 Tax=Arion vulgaris TaxID=1028688 RepID=A0A0B7BV38_9EUPU
MNGHKLEVQTFKCHETCVCSKGSLDSERFEKAVDAMSRLYVTGKIHQFCGKHQP